MEIIMYIIGLFFIGLVVFLIVQRVKETKAKKIADAKAAHPATLAARDSAFTAKKSTVVDVAPVIEKLHTVEDRLTSRHAAPSDTRAADARSLVEEEEAAVRRRNIQREKNLRDEESRSRRASEDEEARQKRERDERDWQVRTGQNYYDSSYFPSNAILAAAILDSSNHINDEAPSREEPASETNTSSSEDYTGIPAYGGSDTSSSSNDYSSSSDSSSSYSSSSDSSSSYSSSDSGSSDSGGGGGSSD